MPQRISPAYYDWDASHDEADHDDDQDGQDLRGHEIHGALKFTGAEFSISMLRELEVVSKELPGKLLDWSVSTLEFYRLSC